MGYITTGDVKLAVATKAGVSVGGAKPATGITGFFGKFLEVKPRKPVPTSVLTANAVYGGPTGVAKPVHAVKVGPPTGILGVLTRKPVRMTRAQWRRYLARKKRRKMSISHAVAGKKAAQLLGRLRGRQPTPAEFVQFIEMCRKSPTFHECKGYEALTMPDSPVITPTIAAAVIAPTAPPAQVVAVAETPAAVQEIEVNITNEITAADAEPDDPEDVVEVPAAAVSNVNMTHIAVGAGLIAVALLLKR